MMGLAGVDQGPLSFTVLWSNNSTGALGPTNQIIGCLRNGALLFNQLPQSCQTVLSPAHK